MQSGDRRERPFIRNQLLARMPAEAFAQLAPHLERVALKRRRATAPAALAPAQQESA